MGQCDSVMNAVQETLVLAFEVGDKTVLDSPEMIGKILADPKLKQAIQTAALSQAKALIAQQAGGKTVTAADVQKDAEKVLSTASSSAQDAALSQLKKTAQSTAEYKKLVESIKQLECAWKDSPTGVFVDKHKGLLILVGSGLALGGVAAMYQFKAGDQIAKPATDALAKLVKFSVLGNVEISADKILFKPSERLVGSTMVATAHWSQVKVNFALGVQFTGTELTQVSGKSTVTIKLFKDLTMTANGSYLYQPGASTSQKPANTHQYDLGIGLSYDHAFGMSSLTINTMMFGKQDATSTQYGGKAGVGVNLIEGTPKSPTSLKIEANGGVNRVLDYVPQPQSAAPKSNVTFTLDLTGHF